ncbi:MAG: sugar phosphate isomerase/epimerase [Clostridia bacterium]|nr:sugar phosphate isomerase/epimerase [Clostridia bacterium]
MWKQKLCLGLGPVKGVSPLDQIELYHRTGFEGFFSGWGGQEDFRKKADELGMIYQSIHAPFTKAADFWKGGDAAETAVAELIACLEDCARVEVPLMVAHTFIGFEDHDPNETGVENFGRVCARAKQLGVQVAFENTEGEEYLAAVMELAKVYPGTVGFCWDTGHEMCYNYSKDMLALYGDLLIATHLNDNLGIKDYDGKITWIDDLHLLPFDGIGDWADIAGRLKKHSYSGILTFELGIGSKPGRHDNDKYMAMDPEVYVAEAYNRACRVAALMQK